MYELTLPMIVALRAGPTMLDRMTNQVWLTSRGIAVAHSGHGGETPVERGHPATIALVLVAQEAPHARHPHDHVTVARARCTTVTLSPEIVQLRSLSRNSWMLPIMLGISTMYNIFTSRNRRKYLVSSAKRS